MGYREEEEIRGSWSSSEQTGSHIPEAKQQYSTTELINLGLLAVAGLADSEVRASSEIALYYYTAHSTKKKKKKKKQWDFYISIMEYDINTVNLLEERCKYSGSK